ncbi:MAG: 23S rRNA (uracil(1939)-C(5))-methyltransferase RlmD, partial [Clostridia bacterium]|nr:23S rRNA (uracil(1939)-C(5))-methyltransferase RlmD [Clostridia bacterium]
GQPDRVLFGSGAIRDTLCGLNFRISAHSFYQVNRDAAELLYRTAIEMAELKSGDTILDAYCGIGTIGMTAASLIPGLRVTGVESNGDAVRDAIANAKANRIQNIRFYRDDAGHFLDTAKDFHPAAVILDPPRDGSDEVFLSALVRAKPEKIVYISCGPEALARDLAYLTKSYHVERIVPGDLFPGTEHVETVVLMSRA